MGLRKQKLYIVKTGEYDQASWYSSGRVTSLVDLRGAQIKLVLPANNIELSKDNRLNVLDNDRSRLSNDLVLDLVSLSFAAGRGIWIYGNELDRVKDKYGVVYSEVLPDKEKDFIAKTSSHD